jgi:hypothetical protein
LISWSVMVAEQGKGGRKPPLVWLLDHPSGGLYTYWISSKPSGGGFVLLVLILGILHLFCAYKVDCQQQYQRYQHFELDYKGGEGSSDIAGHSHVASLYFAPLRGDARRGLNLFRATQLSTVSVIASLSCSKQSFLLPHTRYRATGHTAVSIEKTTYPKNQ